MSQQNEIGNYNTPEITQELSRRLNIPVRDARLYVATTMEIISDFIHASGKDGQNGIRLYQVGTLIVKPVKGRQSVNNLTGDMLNILRHRKIKFIPSPIIKKIMKLPLKDL